VKLTEHFTLEELTFSEYAARLGLPNTPMPRIAENLQYLAERLEEVRALLRAPMRVTSGYRSEAVNAGVGGSAASQHRYGLAADFVAPQFGTPYEVARAIEASGVQFDQLIHEFGQWVHVSFVRHNPRHEALSIFGRGKYLPGIKPKE
jgi:zinc D-Ala-D-Ala carboxypeptidase